MPTANGFLFITDLDKLTARDGKISKQAAPRSASIRWFQHHLGQGLGSGHGPSMEVEGQRPPAPAPGEAKGKTIQVTPNFLGGTNWMPMAYNQDTKLFYIPTNDWSEDYWTENVTYKKAAPTSVRLPHQAPVRHARRRASRHGPDERQNRLGT